MPCYTSRIVTLTASQNAMGSDIAALKAESSEIKGMVLDILTLLNSRSSKVPPTSTDARASVEGEKVVLTEPIRLTPTPTQRLFGQLGPKIIASRLTSTTMIITKAILI